MNEQFDPVEFEAVAAALREYERRCDELMDILHRKPFRRPDRDEATALYTALKGDLKAAAKNGTLSGRREQKNRAEVCFFDPAIRRAAIDLRPATNTNPITSRWSGAVYAARAEFSYWLHNMERPTPRP